MGHAAQRQRAGVTGVALLVGPAALRGLTAGVVGQLAILGAAASYACGGLYGRRLRAVVALAVLSTAVGYVVDFRVLATAGPTTLLLVTFLMPVGGVALGTLVLGERPRFTSLAGMLVIFAALAVIDGRLLRPLRSVRIFGHFRPGGVVGRSRTGC